MGKTSIRIVGFLFLLSGAIYLIDFLWTGDPDIGPLEMNVGGYNIGGFVFILILLSTGMSIIRRRNSGRVWGLVLLWLSFLPSIVGLVVSGIRLINPGFDPENGLNWRIYFKGTEYGLGQDYIITNPWFLFAVSVFFTIFVGAQIYVLSSKKNRGYFTAEMNTGS